MRGEEGFPSGLRFGDNVEFSPVVAPWELIDSSERCGLPVNEPINNKDTY